MSMTCISICKEHIPQVLVKHFRLYDRATTILSTPYHLNNHIPITTSVYFSYQNEGQDLLPQTTYLWMNGINRMETGNGGRNEQNFKKKKVPD